MSRLERSVIEMCDMLCTKLSDLDECIKAVRFINVNESTKKTIEVVCHCNDKEFNIEIAPGVGEFLTTSYDLTIDGCKILSRVQPSESIHKYVEKLYRESLGYMNDLKETAANDKVCDFIDCLNSGNKTSR